MEKENIIFAINDMKINDSNGNYLDEIQWGHTHLNSATLMRLSADEVSLLTKNILDIINIENNSMLGPYEDDAIYDSEVRKNILISLKNYLSHSLNEEKKILKRLIAIFEYAVDNERVIYFDI